MSYDLHLLGTRQLLLTGEPFEARTLAQPKRFAVLTYLAVSGVEGCDWVSRDTLLALFWRGCESNRARKALSQTLWFLAQDLGEDVVVKRGRSDVRVAAQHLRVDVGRFLSACGEARASDALEVYKGDFLAGFHLGGAPGFHHWLDTTRVRLRGLAVDVAWKLAERRASEGDIAGGRHSALLALKIGATLDEGLLRRVMTFLSEHGDRASALSAYESHVMALAGDGYRPVDETVGLADSIRRPGNPKEWPERGPQVAFSSSDLGSALQHS